jgi:hypothetical protein
VPDRDEEIEQPIPVEWRPLIVEIVNDIRDRKLAPKSVSGFEIDVDSPEIELMYQSIDSYGDSLISLPEDAWQTSVCRWMGTHWHVLVDLFTAGEGLSDLVLFIDVYEREGSVCFKIQSIHVP